MRTSRKIQSPRQARLRRTRRFNVEIIIVFCPRSLSFGRHKIFVKKYCLYIRRPRIKVNLARLKAKASFLDERGLGLVGSRSDAERSKGKGGASVRRRRTEHKWGENRRFSPQNQEKIIMLYALLSEFPDVQAPLDHAEPLPLWEFAR